MRYHAQRRHIIHSIDGLCYQLFVFSFLLSPSLLQLIARTTSQFQFSRPRDLDGHRSLKFWIFIICCANTGSVLNHITYRASEVGSGRGLVLDFIGMANLPSKTQLLILDIHIIFLQLVLLCIAYETSLSLVMPPETIDPLSPIDDTSAVALDDTISSPLKQNRPGNVPVLHLRLRPTIRRILDPPPVTPSSDLPLPNTTPFIFPSAGFPIQIAFRTRSRLPIRREAAQNDGEGGDRGDRSLPGGLDVG
ncbi:hypothetical protein JB92DRAFT_2928587 [Gautieria morchelliformis]|nr:hypothetical protein JB92DRAFT_2928587 [Gautieria morchelliformis]